MIQNRYTFQAITWLNGSSAVILLADLESVSLDYLLWFNIEPNGKENIGLLTLKSFEKNSILSRYFVSFHVQTSEEEKTYYIVKKK